MKTGKITYLDYNATTPVDPEVLEAMIPYFTSNFANASSQTHFPGRFAAAAVENARSQVAEFLEADPSEIVFTSGSTEAINLAIRGVARTYHSKGNHIITWQTEHKAVLDTCDYLEKKGFNITKLPVNREGLPDLELYEKSLSSETILTVVMLANNETGVVMPVDSISAIARANGGFVFCDATQAAGKMHFNISETGADLLCISAHKIYGPKGTGVLYVSRKNPRVKLSPLLYGGGHENGMRAGTLNVTGIAGLGKACELAKKRIWEDTAQMSKSRTLIEQILTTNGPGYVNGNIKNRLPNTSNICFSSIRASSLIAALPHLAMATGSACTSALASPSHVLKAMGLSEEEAYSSVRISVGRQTTIQEVLEAGNAILHAIDKLKGI